MRRTLHEARLEMAASLIQPGSITSPAADLTIFVRSAEPNGPLHDIMIWDQRSNNAPVVYLAKRGRIVESATTPAIVLYDGSIQVVEEDGRLNVLDFTELPYELSQFIEPPGQLLYKLSDRFAHELLYPNLTHYWELENQNAMLAEGHARLSAPLHDLAIALIAAMAVMGGRHRRAGYARRIALAGLAALALRVAGFAVQAGAAANPELNLGQYGLPAGVAAILLAIYLAPGLRRPRPVRGGTAAA
jgi:lipopolysaccharide export system permease protein